MKVKDLDCELIDCVLCDLSDFGNFITITPNALATYADYFVLQISADICTTNNNPFVLIDIGKTESN